MIAHAIIKKPERMVMMTQAEAAPQDINSKITQLNLQGRLDAHTCTIQLMSIWSCWHAMNGVNILEANKINTYDLRLIKPPRLPSEYFL
jgi:hypothetical protein